jgi:hypothetical protein
MEAFTLDMLGWIGAALILAAYGLVSSKKLAPDSMAYQGLNIAASILLLINTVYYGAYPSSFVNAIWAVIAVVAVVSVVRTRSGTPA